MENNRTMPLTEMDLADPWPAYWAEHRRLSKGYGPNVNTWPKEEKSKFIRAGRLINSKYPLKRWLNEKLFKLAEDLFSTELAEETLKEVAGVGTEGYIQTKRHKAVFDHIDEKKKGLEKSIEECTIEICNLSKQKTN